VLVIATPSQPFRFVLHCRRRSWHSVEVLGQLLLATDKALEHRQEERVPRGARVRPYVFIGDTSTKQPPPDERRNLSGLKPEPSAGNSKSGANWPTLITLRFTAPTAPKRVRAVDT